MSRRAFLGIAGAAGVMLAGACSSDGQSSAKPGTVKHRFGETTVPAPPQRVVSAGLTDQDFLLAVGVVPIAITTWWGEQPFGVWPWALPKLGAAQPATLTLDNGIPVEAIAALKPDLIVATNAGVDQDTYMRLSQIAPTIPQSGDEPFFEPWKTQADAIGSAVFKVDEMKTLVTQVDDNLGQVKQANPEFDGKKALLLQGRLDGTNVVATARGPRTDFLTALGLQVPDSVTGANGVIPRDQLPRVLDTADVLIWTTETEQEETILRGDNAIGKRRNVFTGRDLSAAIAFSSPLSLPVVAETLPPKLKAALG